MKRTITAFLAIGLVLALTGAAQAAPPVTHDLRAHYDASAIVGLNNGDQITTWVDSASGDDNGTAAGYGAYTGIHYYTNVQNSLPAVRFNTYGGADIGDWFSMNSMTPRHVFFVAKETRTGRTSTIMGQSGAYDWHTGGSSKIWANFTGKQTNWITKQDGMVVSSPDPQCPRFALDTPFNLSVEIPAADAVYTNRMCSDRDGYGYRTWGGDIYEVLIYTGPLTAAEENAVGYYLQEKWSVPGTYVPEPATMAFLGLGACLPLLRRRRFTCPKGR